MKPYDSINNQLLHWYAAYFVNLDEFQCNIGVYLSLDEDDLTPIKTKI